jgi:subtilisin family serine protease
MMLYAVATMQRMASPRLACTGTRALHGYSVYGDDNSDDCYGHGTHVSGIVGGLTFGVAKNVTLYAGQPAPADCQPNSRPGHILIFFLHMLSLTYPEDHE